MTFGRDFELNRRRYQRPIVPTQFFLLVVTALAILMGVLMGYLIF